MLQRNVIRFQYVNGEGQKSTRAAEPEKLIFKDNAWYLVAFCRERQEYRTFRISRLKELEILLETFEPKRSCEQYFEAKDIPQQFIHLKLRFQPKALNRLYDYFDDTCITQNEDGSFTMEVTLPDGEWIYGYILSFGSLVEVLEPEHVKIAIVERIRQTLNIYNP